MTMLAWLFLDGMQAAQDALRMHAMDVRYIMCFRKELSEEDAMDVLQRAAAWK